METIIKTKTIKELIQHIYKLKNDCLILHEEDMPETEDVMKKISHYGKSRFYAGEANAFQIVLDLLEQCEEIKDEIEVEGEDDGK